MRRFRPEDAFRLKAVSSPDLSPDGRRVAFVLVEVDEEADRLASSVWVAPTDGSTPARRFTEGPADKSPRWSPDGRWLAYVSVTDDKPEHAHLRMAPLDGGTPLRLGDLPGPVTQFAWSPEARRLVAVCRVGAPAREEMNAQERNAPRLVRGLAARLDGVGWQDGRRHLFLVDIDGGSSSQLTKGDFDHDDPAFAPDGASIVCASDRDRRRDDRQFRSDAWVIPLGAGGARRLTGGRGSVAFPQFSPDGRLVAFAGQVTDAWDADPHLFVVPADGSGAAEEVAPETDRPISMLFPGLPAPICWTGDRELAVLIADRGAVTVHRAKVGQGRSRAVIGGDIAIDGFAAGRRLIAYTESWTDRPSELYVTTPSGREPARLTDFNDGFRAEVQLSKVSRASVSRPDGTEVEYFTLLPSDGTPRPAPLHLDIHGGPHAWWPSGWFLAFHQALAAAGYCVLLPNPRGSASYGQEFTAACSGDWGGGDYEDILACCDDLIERGVADPERMFVGGGSYGGFMAGWIVGHTDRFRAATALAAVIDHTSMAFTTDTAEFARFVMRGTPWDRPDEYEKRSPLHYLPAVTTPVLVLHWEGDLRVPIGQGEELYAGLKTLGKETEMLRYPGGFHVLQTPSQSVDATRQVLDWNERHDARRGRRSRRAASRG